MKQLTYKLLVFSAKRVEVVLLHGSWLLKEYWLYLGYKRTEWYQKSKSKETS